MHYNAGRTSFGLPCLLKSPPESIKVLGININYIKVKCFKLLVYGVGGSDLIDGAVNLQIIIVHNHAQIVQLAEPGEHGRLPHLAFLDFAVSQ